MIGLDQASKAAARFYLTPGDPKPLVGDIFNLTLAFNEGASFGLFQGMRSLIVMFSFIALGIFLYFLLIKPPNSRLLLSAIAVAGGGVIGNLIDRVVSGRVTDFFDVSIWPVFNVADIAITVGVIFIVIKIMRASPEELSSMKKEAL